MISYHLDWGLGPHDLLAVDLITSFKMIGNVYMGRRDFESSQWDWLLAENGRPCFYFSHFMHYVMMRKERKTGLVFGRKGWEGIIRSVWFLQWGRKAAFAGCRGCGWYHSVVWTPGFWGSAPEHIIPSEETDYSSAFLLWFSTHEKIGITSSEALKRRCLSRTGERMSMGETALEAGVFPFPSRETA